MHYTTLEEIPSGEVVTMGTFLVNQHPVVVLFDSRASHSFMSQIFASKHDQRVVTIDKGGYCISVARNNISTNQIVRDVCISISNQEYTSDLIVLLGLGIVDRMSSAVLRGVSHEGRLIGREVCCQEQEGNRDTRVRQVEAISMI